MTRDQENVVDRETVEGAATAFDGGRYWAPRGEIKQSAEVPAGEGAAPWPQARAAGR